MIFSNEKTSGSPVDMVSPDRRVVRHYLSCLYPYVCSGQVRKCKTTATCNNSITAPVGCKHTYERKKKSFCRCQLSGLDAKLYFKRGATSAHMNSMSGLLHFEFSVWELH